MKKTLPKQIRVYQTEDGLETYRVLIKITKDQFENILFHFDGGDILQFTPDRRSFPLPEPEWISYIDLTGRQRGGARPFVFTYRRYNDRDWFRQETGVFRWNPPCVKEAKKPGRKPGRPPIADSEGDRQREKRIRATIKATRDSWGNKKVYIRAQQELGDGFSLSEVKAFAERDRKRTGRLTAAASSRK